MKKRFILLICTLLAMMTYLTTLVNAEIIREGDSGSHVVELQRMLIAKGLFGGEADGICGAATVSAIKRFQANNGLVVDGICGDDTFNLLAETVDTTIDFVSYEDSSSNYAIKHGMKGADVSELQNVLIALGYMDGTADGVCGDSTVNAIKYFQSTHGMVVDGICGVDTFDMINIDAAAFMAGDKSVAAKVRNNEQTQDNYKSTTQHTAVSTVSTGDIIKLGMQGESVKNLQRKLISRGLLTGNADGICGAETVAAIKKFQSSHGLEVDGVAGVLTLSRLYDISYDEKPKSERVTAETKNEDQTQDQTQDEIETQSTTDETTGAYAKIGSVIKPGMHGEGVTNIQKKLIEHGYLTGEADGVCGARTVAAIKKLQASAGLNVNGICDLLTYAALEDADYNVSDKSWTDSITESQPRGRKMYVEATAYCPSSGSGGSYTARGNPLKRGIIAVDPDVIPLGTRVYIPGYGEAVADDTGSAIKGNIIDIAFDTYNEAMNFGRQYIEIYILDDD